LPVGFVRHRKFKKERLPTSTITGGNAILEAVAESTVWIDGELYGWFDGAAADRMLLDDFEIVE